MTPRRIVIDIDGVLADFNTAFWELLVKLGAEMRPFEEPERMPRCWQWPQEYGATPKQVRAAWAEVTANPEFWYFLSTHPDWNLSAEATLAKLWYEDEVSFVTNRRAGRSYTISWLEDKLALVGPQVVLTPGEKTHALVAMHPDVVIEDRLLTLQHFRQAVKDYKLPACHLILVDRPYNQGDRSGLTVAESTYEALEMAAQSGSGGSNEHSRESVSLRASADGPVSKD